MFKWLAGPSEEGVPGGERRGEPVVQVAGAELARHTGLNTSLIWDTAHRLLAVSTGLWEGVDRGVFGNVRGP